MIILPQDVALLPLHDAAIYSLNIELGEEGTVTALLHVGIHPDESLEFFGNGGIRGSSICLKFANCIKVSTNLLGYAAPREVIDTFDIVESSDLKQQMINTGCGGADCQHFQVVGSSGTRLDFVAQALSVSENRKGISQ